MLNKKYPPWFYPPQPRITQPLIPTTSQTGCLQSYKSKKDISITPCNILFPFQMDYRGKDGTKYANMCVF